MVTIFEVCFYLGVILTAVFFILGHISDFMNIDGVDVDMDIDLDGPDFDLPDMDFDADALDVSGELGAGGYSFLLGLLKPNLIVLFCTLFGGFGLIFINSEIPSFIAAILASGIGGVGVYVINRFLISLLKKESTTVASQNELVGHLGKAALRMEGEQVGSVIYQVNGNTYQSPAKSFEQTPIQRGEDIIIVDIKENLFYVKKF